MEKTRKFQIIYAGQPKPFKTNQLTTYETGVSPAATLSHWGQASSRKQSKCGMHSLSNILKLQATFLYSIYHQRAGKTNLCHMRGGQFHAGNTFNQPILDALTIGAGHIDSQTLWQSDALTILPCACTCVPLYMRSTISCILSFSMDDSKLASNPFAALFPSVDKAREFSSTTFTDKQPESGNHPTSGRSGKVEINGFMYTSMKISTIIHVYYTLLYKSILLITGM